MNYKIESIVDFGINFRKRCLELRKDKIPGLPQSGPLIDKEILLSLGLELKANGIGIDDGEKDIIVTQLLAVSSSKWVDCGMQTIEMGHKFAASLLVSNVSQDILDNVRRPWPAFMILVPDNLIFMQGIDGVISITRVLVSQTENKHGDWSYIAWAKDMNTEIWRFGVGAKMLMTASREDMHTYMGEADPDHLWGELGGLEDIDMRAAALVGRLVITTCAAMTMSDMVFEKNPKVHKVWRNAGGRAENLPEVQAPVYVLGKPITLDFRDRVKDYSLGLKQGKKLEVRTCVSGHFKRQHYGINNSQIKTLWLEPYWRGAETAPVIVRSHLMKDES